MSSTKMLLTGVFALSQMAAAAPAANTMTVHWTHDKVTGLVSMDVGAGESNVPLVSHQFCGQHGAENAIAWDVFADSPLSVDVDQNGLGVIKYAGQEYDTTDCVAMYDDQMSLLQCTLPYSGSVIAAAPSTAQLACLANTTNPLSSLSPVLKSSLADLYLRKREVKSLNQRAEEASSMEARAPQVGPSCFFNRCTVVAGDGALEDTSFQVQISPTLACTDGTCSVGRDQGTSQSVEFSVTGSVNQWISGGFGVSSSYSTGSTLTCDGAEYQTVCIWTGVPHKAYDVQNAYCNTCGGDQDREGVLRMTSPVSSDSAYCVRNACRTQGEGYYP